VNFHIYSLKEGDCLLLKRFSELYLYRYLYIYPHRCERAFTSVSTFSTGSKSHF